MKTKLLVLAACLIVSASSCVLIIPTAVIGNGVVTSEKRSVGTFDEVCLTAVADVVVTRGEVQRVTVIADENLLPFITTEVFGDELVVGTMNGYSLIPTGDIRVLIEVPSLERAELTGVGDMTVSGISCSSFEASMSGVGTIVLEGSTTASELTLTGVGGINAYNLQSATTDAKISGSGDISLWVTSSLTARISGIGDIEYRGNPTYNLAFITGIGDVIQVY